MHKRLLVTIICLVYLIANSQAENVEKLKIGDRFPNIEGELLSYKKIRLPEHCKGKVAVLIVAFKRGTQNQIDTWTRPLLKEFGMFDEFRFIEIPMISNFYSWMSNYIDNGMRRGIVESMHKNVMTYYGPLGDYYQYFDVDDKKQCYLFLLDQNGNVQFMEKGNAKSDQLQRIIKIIQQLLAR